MIKLLKKDVVPSIVDTVKFVNPPLSSFDINLSSQINSRSHPKNWNAINKDLKENTMHSNPDTPTPTLIPLNITAINQIQKENIKIKSPVKKKIKKLSLFNKTNKPCVDHNQVIQNTSFANGQEMASAESISDSNDFHLPSNVQKRFVNFFSSY